MAGNTVRKIKWFFPWQDEQEEAWLRSMSQRGWHLASVALPCTYRFRAGEPTGLRLPPGLSDVSKEG